MLNLMPAALATLAVIIATLALLTAEQARRQAVRNAERPKRQAEAEAQAQEAARTLILTYRVGKPSLIFENFENYKMEGKPRVN